MWDLVPRPGGLLDSSLSFQAECNFLQSGLFLQGSLVRDGNTESLMIWAGGENGFQAGLHSIAGARFRVDSAGVPGGALVAPGGLELHSSLSNGDAAASDSLPKASQRLNSVVQSWRMGSQGRRG